MANSNLTPNAGNLNLSDKNPRLTPLAGVLLAVGFAASLINTSGATTIIPGRGQLTATGVASGLTQQTFAQIRSTDWSQMAIRKRKEFGDPFQQTW